MAIFKLPIRITEFNMPGQRSKYLTEKILTMTPEEEAQNAKELVDYYRICFAHPAVDGMIMWGFWAGANWIPASSLYRRDWSISQTGEAYRKLVFNEWWTKTTQTAGKDGVVSIPGYYGRYKVTVNGKAQEVVLSKKEGKAMVDVLK